MLWVVLGLLAGVGRLDLTEAAPQGMHQLFIMNKRFGCFYEYKGKPQ